MARTNNLTNFLTDVANAIKTKTGDSTPIPASQFDTKIADISTGNLSDEEYAEANDDLDNILQGSTPTKIYPPNWSEIGYEDTPQGIIDGFNYAKEIYDNWDSSVISLNNKFYNNKKLMIFPSVDTSNVINMQQAFAYSSLFSIPLIDTSKVTDFKYAFRGCIFTEIPLLDFSSGGSFTGMFVNCNNLVEIPTFTFATTKRYSMSSMFSSCTSLKNVPLLDIKNVDDISNMFSNCSSLTNESLNNIMGMCISATKITSNKTLKYIGLSQAQAEVCQTLSNYQAFLDAGWTTGY